MIGCRELIHAGGSLSACLLLLTNLRGKIGIQLVWPEDLSLSFSFICYPISWPLLQVALCSPPYSLSPFPPPFLFSPYRSQNFLMTAAANPTQRGELNSISRASGALSCLLFILAFLHSIWWSLWSLLSRLSLSPHTSPLLLPPPNTSINPHRWKDRARVEKEKRKRTQS